MFLSGVWQSVGVLVHSTEMHRKCVTGEHICTGEPSEHRLELYNLIYGDPPAARASLLPSIKYITVINHPKVKSMYLGFDTSLQLFILNSSNFSPNTFNLWRFQLHTALCTALCTTLCTALWYSALCYTTALFSIQKKHSQAAAMHFKKCTASH